MRPDDHIDRKGGIPPQRPDHQYQKKHEEPKGDPAALDKMKDHPCQHGRYQITCNPGAHDPEGFPPGGDHRQERDGPGRDRVFQMQQFRNPDGKAAAERDPQCLKKIFAFPFHEIPPENNAPRVHEPLFPCILRVSVFCIF